jgi:hypothetical protein
LGADAESSEGNHHFRHERRDLARIAHTPQPLPCLGADAESSDSAGISLATGYASAFDAVALDWRRTNHRSEALRLGVIKEGHEPRGGRANVTPSCAAEPPPETSWQY